MRRSLIPAAALALFAGCADGSSTGEPVTTSTSRERTTSPSTSGDAPADPAGGAVVVEVVDGDTLVVEVGGERERLRLVGINAPERDECLADEATRWLRERVDGRQVELVVDRSDRDRYGRLLRYVEVDGADVGAGLVRAGLALARRYPPDTGRADEYERLQREAEQAGIGLWAPEVCGPALAGADVAITEVRFDADGDDNRNLDDEWVRITNRGEVAVDLGGWVLKDTSATHRYTFPDGFVLEAGAGVTVRTGCGVDTLTDLHWCNEGSAVWNNSGDTAVLLDPSGNVVDSVDR
jgi:endonuclease YncB( thermonuclease family)